MATTLTAGCVMMQQIRYKNARTALKSETTWLRNRLIYANLDLEKFKDASLSVHDYDKLLARLATHDDMIQKKVALCNEKLGKLHTLLDEVANKEKG